MSTEHAPAHSVLEGEVVHTKELEVFGDLRVEVFVRTVLLLAGLAAHGSGLLV